MSSIHAQHFEGHFEGPFVLKYAQTMGMQPYLVTAELYCLLDLPVEDRPLNFQALVKKSVDQFENTKLALRRLMVDNAWTQARWDRNNKICYNLKCELCTLDQAIVDYLRSLPPAFRASIDLPALSEDEVRETKVAYRELMKRAAAITG